VHDLAETPLEGSRDVFVRKESPSLGFDDCVFPNPLDHSHVSPMYLQPSPFPKYTLLSPLIILLFAMLILICAMRIASLMCLVGMFIILCP